jgi:serine protease SohB
MDYLFDYLMFLAQAVTVVIAILIVVSMVATAKMRGQGGERGHLAVTKINDRVRNLRFVMEDALLTPQEAKRRHKSEQKSQKAADKQAAADAKKAAKVAVNDNAATQEPGKVFVLRFEGDVAASDVDNFRLEISAILTMATSNDEVVVCIESPGGMVHSYGLAASQMMRVRNHNIPLTAVVDKVAASGGYLMAAVANKIVAAPFAVIGSIGVVAQVPNVHRLLKKNDVDVEVLTAGKYKRTLTLLGENTDEGREKFQQELEDVHELFQEFVVDNRPGLDIAAVATGEAWYGSRALALNLVDSLATSDEYLMQACAEKDVFQVSWKQGTKPIDRLLGKASAALDRVNQLLEFTRK